MSATTTLAPAAAKPMAVARPIPDPAPVTSATRPSIPGGLEFDLDAMLDILHSFSAIMIRRALRESPMTGGSVLRSQTQSTS
jgi:hypothetical protein